MPTAPGGAIAHVEPDSLGEEIGLEPGDRLLAINGHVLRDIIDVQFYGAEEELALRVERQGQEHLLVVERDYDEPLGLHFANPTFDVDIRRCANNCEFCFVKHNARGMRKSLHVKDDDYRYSFLFGNYVTLTNLTDEDWTRLGEQRLSPLYVSVHASDLDLRRRFLRNRNAPHVMDQLQRLAQMGIEVHTQIVLVPGLNDGPYLDQTLSDLIALYDQPVASIGVVPIGLTKYHTGTCRTYTRGESEAILDLLDIWRQRLWDELGSVVVYPSDEWYLVAGRTVPDAQAYDGFPQLENGVGMVRQLLDEWSDLKERLSGARLASGTLVCGTLIAPVLARIVHELQAGTGADVALVPVENEFFGAVTTVSGLLAGRDVVTTLASRALGQFLLLPRAMFTGAYGAGQAPPGTTLDDLHISDIGTRLGVQARMVDSLAEVIEVLSIAAASGPGGAAARP